MEYQVIRSSRKTVALQITEQGALLLRCPYAMTEAEISQFLEKHRDWIEKHTPQHQSPTLPNFSSEEVRQLANRALGHIPPRVKYWAERMGISYGRITIRNQKTRWGSCSSVGNLNFNCTLVLAPPEVMDYVIIHELCHRKQMNHSPKFWAEVERFCPNHKTHRRWLKDHSKELIGRLP